MKIRTVDTIKTVMIALFWIILVVLGIVAPPLVAIWALNTLFSVGIAYTIWTWLAAFVILLFLRAPVSVSKT